MSDQPQEKKIIVDEDWKSQVQAEKEMANQPSDDGQTDTGEGAAGAGPTDAWLGKRYQACRTGTAILEALLAGYMILCFTLACSLQMWFSLPFLYLFLHGYCYMTYLTLHHERASRRFDDRDCRRVLW